MTGSYRTLLAEKLKRGDTGARPRSLVMNWRTTLSLFLVILLAFVYDRVTKGIPSPLVPGQAPESRFELVPVESYDAPARAGGIDIIVVHGLGSNPDTTWRARRPPNPPSSPTESRSDHDQYVNWVSDFLPSDIPPEIRDGVRIFFLNYHSYWMKDAVFTRLQAIGNNLLQHIDSQLRRSEEEKGRWLVFVGYSYGGLVVKQALVQARQRREFGHIAEYTRAILFLGTPHRGSSFGTWGWLAASALQPQGSNPSILANLQYDSIELNDLHEQFLASIRDDLQVVNFYEQRPIPLFKIWFFQWQIFCVPESSATYGGKGVGKIGLPVDHYGLNKFESRNECYNSIMSKLVKIISPLAKPLKTHYVVPIETAPTFTQREGIWNELEKKLQKRNNNTSVPFAVTLHGLGGSGKSQLALKYAEVHADRYNPILWIDGTSEETVRSSFARCAEELELPHEQGNHRSTALWEDQAIQNVLRWLRGRAEVDDEWLVIVDNVDDVSWGIKKVMPKGSRGRLIITSQDDLSRYLIDGGCEQVHVDVMSPPEARMLLLRHLSDDLAPPPEAVLEDCDTVAKKLGYLPLAIDLAGAYVGNSLEPEQALHQYLEDYEKHQDELLQMNDFRGLSSTEKTVWTVWDRTLEKIEREYNQWQPGLLLTFLAHFNGTVVQDEMFRLASFGMSAVDKILREGNIYGIRDFILENDRGWNDFRYRRSLNILIRFNLIKRVKGEWPGTTMHRLVQWRAMPRDQNQQWQLWYTKFVLAACSRVLDEGYPAQFRQHLIVHLPDVENIDLDWISEKEVSEVFIWRTLGTLYKYEGRWKQAAQFYVQVMESLRPKVCDDHPDLLTAMNNLGSIYSSNNQWEEAEQLFIQVIKTRMAKPGYSYPQGLTLTSAGNLALSYWRRGRWKEAEQLQVQVLDALKAQLGDNHSETLECMNNLAATYSSQGRLDEAERLHIQVWETRKSKFGDDHLDTLMSMSNLASAYSRQSRWKDAERLFAQVLEKRKAVLSDGHPETLTSMNNLVSTYFNQGRLDEAEQLQMQMIETWRTKHGFETSDQLHYPDTWSMDNLASIYSKQGRRNEAEELFIQVIESRRTELGDDHPETLHSMNSLAFHYENQRRWEAAEQLLLQVLEKRKTNFGEHHPDTLGSMDSLARFYMHQGRLEEAEQLFLQVREMSKATLGEDHPETLRHMFNLAYTWKSSGKAMDAIRLLKDCLTKHKNVLGPNHPHTIFASETLRKWEADEAGVIG